MHLGTLIAAALTAVFLLASRSPAQAQSLLEAELAVIDLEIKNQTRIGQEIKRQTEFRRVRLGLMLEWVTLVQDTVKELEHRAVKEFEHRIAWAGKARALLGSLHKENDPGFHLPFYGEQTPETMERYAQDLRDQLQHLQTAMREGKWDVYIFGYGWTTGAGVQGEIDKIKNQLTDLEQAYYDGTLEVWIGGIGWVKAGDVSAKIAAAEQQKADLQKRIADGVYEMMIPGVGLRTRKALDAEIDALKAELEKLRASVANGEIEVKNLVLDWTTPAKMRLELELRLIRDNALVDNVEDNVEEVWMPEVGMVFPSGLQNQLKELQRKLAELQEQLGSGVYLADTFIGWTERKGTQELVRKWTKELRDPNVTGEYRELLTKNIRDYTLALTDYQKIAAFHVEGYQADLVRMNTLIESFLTLFKPEVRRRLVERRLIEASIEDYPKELEVVVSMKEMRLAFLQKSRELFPK